MSVARKSRKQNDHTQFFPQKSTYIQTAAYVRLSKEDIAHKGDSIETQKRIISNYIEEHPDFRLYDTYADTGASGTTFDRRGFQRMLRDAESGKIKCIIVKDLSRLGRNLIDTGYFTEIVFPQLGVRLIAINDNYDTDKNSDSISIPLIHLMNEAYALDISKKTKLQVQQAMRDGVYVGGRPPYGYIMSQDDRHKLIVDKLAADIVKQIFEWAAGGANIYEIARRLNTAKTPPPGIHKSKLESLNKQSSSGGLWYARTIERILANQVYLGQLVQGKTKVVDFHRCAASCEEWVYAFNTHEAIITYELFQIVKKQKAHENKQNILNVAYSPNLLKGRIYCAHCGNHLERKRNHNKYIYRCVANRTSPGLCIGNAIQEDTIKRALLEQLTQYRDVLIDSLNQPSIEREVLPELQWIEMELSGIQDITQRLYEDLVKGVLDRQGFVEMKRDYQKTLDTLNKRATALTQTLNNEKAQIRWARESLYILEELVDTGILTQKCIDRFIGKISVYCDSNVYVECSRP